MNATFSRNERLKSNKIIHDLFAGKRSFFEYPYRVRWTFLNPSPPSPSQVLFSVSKSVFRHAVDRNLVKRRTREAYRLNKYILDDSLMGNSRKMAIGFSYTAKEILPFSLIQEKIILILHRLIKENEKVTG